MMKNIPDQSTFPPDAVKYAESGAGMAATAFPEATDAAVEILRAGGNAVDAACAAALALAVCEPQASGLGGQTMMLIGNNSKVIAIDGSSRAPSLAHVHAIYEQDRSVGYRACTVPATPAVLFYTLNRYGTKSWSRVLEPAIRIATDGYRITALQSRLQARELPRFSAVQSGSGAKYFLDNNQPFAEGTLFRQPDLARLLKKMAATGVEDFYQGTTARQIDADMRGHGGLLRYDDLALIPLPIERKPLKGKFRNHIVWSMPPPGAGRTLLFALQMIDALPEALIHGDDKRRVHIFAGIFRKALLERSDRPFDPNFFSQVAEKDMLKIGFARRSIRSIIKTIDHSILPFLSTEDEMAGETTHLAVIDKDGLAVSLTQSIERAYGCKAVTPGLGFLYNNYILDFDYQQPQHPFYLRPNAVPWATVAPSLIFKGNRLWMAVGSPGSERIFSTIAQFLLNTIDHKMSLTEAMRAPRMHCSLGGRVSVEAGGFTEEIQEYLREQGYRIDIRERYSFYLGAIHAVQLENGNRYKGVAEIRRDGKAGGI